MNVYEAADNFQSTVGIKVMSPSFYWSINEFYEDLAKTTSKENDFGQDSQNHFFSCADLI